MFQVMFDENGLGIFRLNGLGIFRLNGLGIFRLNGLVIFRLNGLVIFRLNSTTLSVVLRYGLKPAISFMRLFNGHKMCYLHLIFIGMNQI